jgi:dimeric dUTPase (all-alpha-NTP-PPase superfamily)
MNQPLNFTLEEIQTLLAMQDELNTYIHPEWKTQNFDWGFAIIDEVREIREHLGWKWWKKDYQCGITEANRKQVQLEVIDILHFVLSLAGETCTDPERVRTWLNRSYGADLVNDMVPACTNMIFLVSCESADYFEAWNDLAVIAGLTKEEVLETYIQKFVLNKFRQDHGYKDGSYCKTWESKTTVDGWIASVYKEDNEVLADLVQSRKESGLEVTDQEGLYNDLKILYNEHLNK